ncbi:riboflavin synthase [Lignipirellula cremea]|uniref:Riboflavin synthase n=1 Tax=Lignipirellula cremea TaxID=2528010 RepID=A0A518DWT5_9BACT|nr:riboflavin synthase [Lignipirellula cremea]QDU96298.1 Riboflavin synthase [Lignipirellula cremea]
MFTGLVEATGALTGVEVRPPGVRMSFHCPLIAGDAELGDSIAVNGCCLTVVARDGDVIAFDAGLETLSRTNLGRLRNDDRVNLERSLAVGDRMGGHYVSGHVDGVGRIDQRHDEADWSTFWFWSPPRLTRQMVSKGSITIDGVSLTLVNVEKERFSVALIPHTLSATTLGAMAPGHSVNLETDLLAKYVERQMAFVFPPAQPPAP